MSKIAITTGDPNGIGAEITIKALNTLNLPVEKVLLISNRKVLDFYGKLNSDYEILEIPYDAEIEPGKVTKAAGEFSFLSVKKLAKLMQKQLLPLLLPKTLYILQGTTLTVKQKFFRNSLHMTTS